MVSYTVREKIIWQDPQHTSNIDGRQRPPAPSLTVCAATIFCRKPTTSTIKVIYYCHYVVVHDNEHYRTAHVVTDTAVASQYCCCCFDVAREIMSSSTASGCFYFYRKLSYANSYNIMLFDIFYQHMPIGKVSIYRLLFVILFVCCFWLHGYGFLRRG